MWGGVGAVLAAGLGFAMTAAVARAIGAAGAGTVFAGIALATILLTLATAGADTGMLWALPRDRAIEAGRGIHDLLVLALVPVGVLGLVSAGGLWFAAPTIAGHLEGGPDALPLLRVMCLAVALGPVVMVALQATRGLGDVKPFVGIQQVGLPLVRLLGVLVLAAAGLTSPVAFGWSWALPLGLALVGALVVVRRRARRASGTAYVWRRPRRDLADSFWRYSLLRGVGAACSMALLWTDVLLVALLTSPAAAGVYAVASRFATSGQIVLQAMRLGIAPQVSVAFAKGDTEQVGMLYSVTTVWAILLSWPIFGTLGVFAPALLRLFGDQYDTGATALAILCAGMMVAVAVGNVGTLLLMSGHSSWATRNVAAALAVNLVVNLLLIPPFGIAGAAWAWTASIAVENLLGLWAVRRYLGVRGHDRSLTVVAVLTLVLSLGVGLAVRAALGPTLPALALHLVVLGLLLVGLVALRRDDLQLGVLRGARRA